MNMKKTFIVLIGIAVVVLGAWYVASLLQPPVPTALSVEQPAATVAYACDGGKTIVATYYRGTATVLAGSGQPPTPAGHVQVALSDGRSITLPQTISADGARYANADGSFVFWSKGDGAMVLENGQQSDYTNCVAANAPGAQQRTSTQSTNLSGPAYVAGNVLLGTDANSTLGTYLIGYNGMTVYAYAKDTPSVSNCTGTCAGNWLPYTVASTDALANLQAGVSGKAGVITRADGTMQVTYNCKPLYFYSKDAVSGDTKGQNIGGVWFIVKP